MESLVIMNDFWRGKRVFLTGHTGFKGSWLSLWLQSMGAHVIGYSLEPPSDPSLFQAAKVAEGMLSITGDILELSKLQSRMQENKPDVIIHMAAQSLVRNSYQFPLETLSTNIMGTANVLEAARHVDSIRVIICVTSDKCYENREWFWGYRENEPMGGHDPYSASKGCAELVISSYRRSFYASAASIASVRAGNVIGGGDWAVDRIVPDCIRAINQGKSIIVRNPRAIRPWQHVLEPLAGYLLLAERLWEDGSEYTGGWNFGPEDNHTVPVETIVNMICDLWGEKACWALDKVSHPQEANLLKLDSSKAVHRLAWKRLLTIKDTVDMTISWYKKFYEGEDARKLTIDQITQYQSFLRENSDA